MSAESIRRRSSNRGFSGFLQGKVVRKIGQLYPFTWPGTLLFGVAFYLIGEAYNGSNVYAFLFSSGSFFLLFFLAILGQLQAFRLSRLNLVWDTSRLPVAGDNAWEQILQTGDASAFYFFRIHFRIDGDFFAGNSARFRLRAESAISGGGSVALPIRFPVSGKLVATGGLVVRDVFGLTRAAREPSETRSLFVRPPIGDQERNRKYQSLKDDESRRHQKTAEEEKYYMRAYQPGDRMKDINWKASFRVMDLITMISPLSQEESRLLHIEFRHYRDVQSSTIESVVQLEFLKRWLLSFLHQIKKSHPEFKFRVVTGEGPRMIETDRDLEQLAFHLGGLGYLPYSRMHDEGEFTPRERIVFATGFESRPPAVPSGGRIRLFRTVRGGKEKSFPVQSFFSPELRPGLWIFRRNKKPAGVLSGAEAEVMEEKIRIRYF